MANPDDAKQPEDAMKYPLAPEVRDALAFIVSRLFESEHGAPEGLKPTDAAKYLGISVSKLHLLQSARHMPRPANLGVGNYPRYPRSELKAWLLSGAPVVSKWNQMRESAIRKCLK